MAKKKRDDCSCSVSTLPPPEDEAPVDVNRIAMQVRKSYLARIGGPPPNMRQARCVEISRGRWRITIWTQTGEYTQSPTHGDCVLADENGVVTEILPARKPNAWIKLTDPDRRCFGWK